MKALKLIKILLVLLMGVIIVGDHIQEAYARTASITTHATIVILPRSENENSELKDEKLTHLGIEDSSLITKVDKRDTFEGERLVYTTIGTL